LLDTPQSSPRVTKGAGDASTAHRAPLGKDIEVNISVVPNLASVSDVIVVFRVGWGPQQQVTAAPAVQSANGGVEDAVGGDSHDEARPSPHTDLQPQQVRGRLDFTARIPAAAFQAGDLVRWAVQVSFASGSSLWPVRVGAS
jgi:hypothetical protein